MLTVDERHLPLTLFVPGMTDTMFEQLSERYGGFRIHYSGSGDLVVRPRRDPAMEHAARVILDRLQDWSKGETGGVVSSEMDYFTLPDDSRLSAAAAWSSPLAAKEHNCPEFVIELISTADNPKVVFSKMYDWTSNGAQLGWVVDLASRRVTVVLPQESWQEPREVTSIAGCGPVTGFVLDLNTVWTI
jgi:Uma2 family endonuclease